MARILFRGARLEVLGISPGHLFAVFRIVKSSDPDDPAFLDSLRSNFELTKEPRKVERESTVTHMGISVYTARYTAAATASRFPKTGSFTARFNLKHGHGFNYAHTGPTNHLTMWADPVKLREVLVDIEPV